MAKPPKPRITEQFLVTLTREGDIPNLTDVIGNHLWSIDKVAPNGVVVERCEASPVQVEVISPTHREKLARFIGGRRIYIINQDD